MEESSYLDVTRILDPNFAAINHANSLVLATNDASDTCVDLATPLSRALFDLQEVDRRIDRLASRNAFPLLQQAQAQHNAGQTIVQQLDGQVAALSQRYQRLQEEIMAKYQTAEQVRQTADRLWHTVKLGRSLARFLTATRQLESQLAEAGLNSDKLAPGKDDHRAMVRAATSICSISRILQDAALDEIDLVRHVQSTFLGPTEASLQARSQQIIREFSMSTLLPAGAGALSTHMHGQETRARTTSALLVLHLLSPPAQLSALQGYLRTALTSSLAALGRALGNITSLDRTLLEVSARCQNILALEDLLRSINRLDSKQQSFLDPLLSALDTSSLASYFWRSLAEGLGSRVADLLNKGGVAARVLRSQRDRLRESIRQCVIRGSQLPSAATGTPATGWEREAAVMVSSVLGPLGR